MIGSPSAVVGAVLGTAVGDALGLPYEGLSARRGRRLFGEPDRYHLLCGRGMVSDDTEHTCMVMQALMAAGNDEEQFLRQWAWRLRLWLLGLPAGIGMATLKATLKLWIGFPPHRSGVYSAGNGPAMRSAVLGAAIADQDQLRRLVKASTRLTHTDPKAEYGALAVAMAARMASGGELPDGKRFLAELRRLLPDEGSDELLQLLDRAVGSVDRGEGTADFAVSLGLGKGVSGYMYHSVPVALHAWLSHPHDFRSAVLSVIRCGGDTDTTAAIVGGIVGSAVGKQGIPQEWLSGLAEWPRSVAWMERLGEELSAARTTGTVKRPPRLPAMPVLAQSAANRRGAVSRLPKAHAAVLMQPAAAGHGILMRPCHLPSGAPRRKIASRVRKPLECRAFRWPQRNRSGHPEAVCLFAENADSPNPALLISEHDLVNDHWWLPAPKRKGPQPHDPCGRRGPTIWAERPEETASAVLTRGPSCSAAGRATQGFWLGFPCTAAV